MGDRAQIALKQYDESKIYLYSHWGGSENNDVLRKALQRGRGRWSDREYLARIIFSDMIRDYLDETTGFGIGTQIHGDIEHPVPVLDCSTQTISWEMNSRNYASMSFEEFVGGDK